MPVRPVRLLAPSDATTSAVTAGLAALREEVELPGAHPPDVLAEAQEAARRGPDDARVPGPRADRTDVPFVTVDPVGSTDLDQAVHVERRGAGWRVRYAIADVAAFVAPGGPLDAETHRRGLTCYSPDGRVPLHPTVLSEGAASLLPGQVRPAVLWSIDLDADGEPVDVHVERATVRSRAQLAYGEVQDRLDAGTADDLLQSLAAVGRLREARERDRGGASLDVPEQEVVRADDGTFGLRFRATLPVEGWNAQISLLTGIVAARLMLDVGAGVVRTLPPADPRDVARLRRTARALDIDWPDDVPYPDLLAGLDSRLGPHAAFLREATTLFRGAGYRTFGPHEAPPTGHDAEHGAIRAPYAHVTAPLRRLVDRYGTEVCLAAVGGHDVPGWVQEQLPELPATMSRTGRRVAAFDRGVLDLVEAAVLAPRVGQVFTGVVVDADEPRDGRVRGALQLRDPAVVAPVTSASGVLPLGETLDARLDEVSVPHRRVTFVAR
ncbi:RNB domain-containing ribonuclease [Cellulomonas sp. zg-ZUI22]|uniref:RNB domain-containing ribonuclease n=1 Tax=Cellulomonas sp. zg-ZUI22 TaxID=2816955 RepID=UPI001A953423|nr:RNB domain-containing ribonuclease [Cellulomonas sp. zg-ZUI22]MBO0899352.1 RNB domain-containing ribonuclease [Cellulomonas sp. zg-ZUI22]